MTDTATTPTPFEAVIVGGGPAGLQAAMTLGRVHRRVLLLDSGVYRNDPADAMHNLAGHDGAKPADYRAVVHAELAAYSTVEIREAAATDVVPDEAGYTVRTSAGEVRGRRLLLATGMRDTLPDTPGVAELFGTVVAHCPFCHGHEYAGTHVAILGAGPHVTRTAMIIDPVAARCSVLTDGETLDDDTLAVLQREGVAVRTEKVTGMVAAEGGAVVSFEAGPEEVVGGVFVATDLAPSAPLAEQLGLDVLPSGAIEVDAFGRTSRPGVYAAGDGAHQAVFPMPLAAVGVAAASGLVAASAIVMDQVQERLG